MHAHAQYGRTAHEFVFADRDQLSKRLVASPCLGFDVLAGLPVVIEIHDLVKVTERQPDARASFRAAVAQRQDSIPQWSRTCPGACAVGVICVELDRATINRVRSKRQRLHARERDSFVDRCTCTHFAECGRFCSRGAGGAALRFSPDSASSTSCGGGVISARRCGRTRARCRRGRSRARSRADAVRRGAGARGPTRTGCSGSRCRT